MEEKQRIRDEKRNARRATKRERRIVENSKGTDAESATARNSEKPSDPEEVIEKSGNEKVVQ